MPTFKFDKLVRDKIIEHQINSGAKPAYHLLGAEDHKRELVQKIMEEAAEISGAPAGEVAEEIADVQQALDDLKALYGLSDEDVRVAQAAKNAKNGAFAKGIYVDAVTVSEGDKWIAYYRDNADRYPEIK